MTQSKVDALLFDKDGTLFDFQRTWSRWAAGLIDELSQGDAARREKLAEAMHFDLSESLFRPTSPIIAGTNREAAECVAHGMGTSDVATIEKHLMHSAAKVPQAPVLPLAPLFEEFAARELRIGLMTNDTEFAALAHLRGAGVEGYFDLVIGFDSGHGAKPSPDPLLAFAEAMDVRPGRVAMVGDSTHDLLAGRAAGMQTIAVLTGTATFEELGSFADVVLPDIGHIPDWLTL